MGDHRPYRLTQTAERDFRDAKNWSIKRWGRELTQLYFQDLHDAALYVSKNHHSLRYREDLVAHTGLMIYPVREHYMVFLPAHEETIIIVALIRQGRDIAAILSRHAYQISKEIKAVQMPSKAQE